MSFSNSGDQLGGPALLVHFCANLEEVLWDVGECIDAFLIGGTEFLGVDNYTLYNVKTAVTETSHVEYSRKYHTAESIFFFFLVFQFF